MTTTNLVRKLILVCIFVVVLIATSGNFPRVYSMTSDKTQENVRTNILENAIRKYKMLSTYRDRVTSVASIYQPGQGKLRIEDTYEFKFARPNKFSITSIDGQSFYYDGKYFVSHMPRIAKYIRDKDFSVSDWKKHLGKTGDLIRVLHPVADLTLNDTKPNSSLLSTAQVVSIQKETFAGEAGKTVKIIADFSLVGFSKTQRASLWFSDKTGLLKKIYASNDNGAKSESESSSIEITFREIKTNYKANSKDFTFSPREIDREVTEFFPKKLNPKLDYSKKLTSDDGTLMYLKGRLAPDILIKDLNGRNIKISDYRGKIVLLDFWGAWCAYCAVSMTHLADISTIYKNNAHVVVLGVNMDDPDDDNLVKRYLAEKKLDLRQFRDRNSKMSTAYRVVGTPTIVLIDSKGVIREIHTGLAPLKFYTTQIDKLLAEVNGAPDAKSL